MLSRLRVERSTSFSSVETSNVAEYGPGVMRGSRCARRPGVTALVRTEAQAFGETAHGIAHWPFGPARRDPRPEKLPDGRPWPRVRVLTFPSEDATGLSATVASVVGQAYPESRHDVVAAGPAAEAALRAACDDPGNDYLLLLRSGDLLAPGALVALCLEAALSGADRVTGLRVLFDDGVVGLDVLGEAAGTADQTHPFTGGEVLLSRAAIARAGGLDGTAAFPVAAAWRRLDAAGASMARIGRPVLLQRLATAHRADRPGGLTIAGLTDTGLRGGAGIAHRRLTEALRLSGHRVVDLRLTDESPAGAAEWTDDFPRTEAAILGGGYDLVLAGNLHGATRRTGILARLGHRLPVAAVLHDLFPLTGRCAFPSDCGRIASGCDALCPSSTAYPQLAPGRIAAAFAEKRAVLTGPDAPLLLANSAWTAATARDLGGASLRIERIDLAFPAGVFRPPADRDALRRSLGLPRDDVLVVFAAVIADAPGKGFSDLVAVLRQVARPGIGFVAVGRLDDPAVFGLPNLVVAGPVTDEASLARWYGACDIHVTASRTETLGQTPVEAALCGTPTVAYAACGLTDAVIDGVTGILVPPDPTALAAALAALIADEPRRRRLGAFARIAFESRFSHAAAAIRLHDVLVGQGLLPAPSDGRIGFTPEMLGRFAFARERHPGSAGTVAARSHPVVRSLRRAKHAVFGRGMPLWARRAVFAAIRLRRGAGLGG